MAKLRVYSFFKWFAAGAVLAYFLYASLIGLVIFAIASYDPGSSVLDRLGLAAFSGLSWPYWYLREFLGF